MDARKVHGRPVVPGTELSVRGESGRFTFRWMTGDDFTCWGGRTGHEKYRTFAEHQIRRVHVKPKLRHNQEKQ